MAASIDLENSLLVLNGQDSDCRYRWLDLNCLRVIVSGKAKRSLKKAILTIEIEDYLPFVAECIAQFTLDGDTHLDFWKV